MHPALAALLTMPCPLTPATGNASLVTLSMAPQLLMTPCRRNPELAEGIVKRLLMAFWHDDQGQDLIEYTLLLAFVCLATAALFISSGGSLSGIWITANSQLSAANTASAS